MEPAAVLISPARLRLHFTLLVSCRRSFTRLFLLSTLISNAVPVILTTDLDRCKTRPEKNLKTFQEVKHPAGKSCIRLRLKHCTFTPNPEKGNDLQKNLYITGRTGQNKNLKLGWFFFFCVTNVPSKKLRRSFVSNDNREWIFRTARRVLFSLSHTAASLAFDTRSACSCRRKTNNKEVVVAVMPAVTLTAVLYILIQSC